MPARVVGRMQWRETGSIVVDVPRERVEAVLSRWMDTDPSVRRVSPERFEVLAPNAGLSTFIVRDDGSRTRVIHARTSPMQVSRGLRAREALRGQVEEELARVERLVRAYAEP